VQPATSPAVLDQNLLSTVGPLTVKVDTPAHIRRTWNVEVTWIAADPDGSIDHVE